MGKTEKTSLALLSLLDKDSSLLAKKDGFTSYPINNSSFKLENVFGITSKAMNATRMLL